jgi:hypothetical protein
MLRRTAVENIDKVFNSAADHIQPRFMGCRPDVRKSYDIRHFQQRRISGKRLFLEDVQTSRAKMADLQRVN